MPLPQNMQQAAEKAEAWSFEPLPVGTYYLECTEVDLDAPLKGGEGRKAHFTFQVAPGQTLEDGSRARRVKVYWNLKHGIESTASKLKSIFDAYGLPFSATESQILNGGVVMGYLTIKEGGQYNDLGSIKAADGEYSYSAPAGNSAQSDESDAWE
jgi:hypothetical protein